MRRKLKEPTTALSIPNGITAVAAAGIRTANNWVQASPAVSSQALKIQPFFEIAAGISNDWWEIYSTILGIGTASPSSKESIGAVGAFQIDTNEALFNDVFVHNVGGEDSSVSVSIGAGGIGTSGSKYNNFHVLGVRSAPTDNVGVGVTVGMGSFESSEQDFIGGTSGSVSGNTADTPTYVGTAAVSLVGSAHPYARDLVAHHSMNGQYSNPDSVNTKASGNIVTFLQNRALIDQTTVSPPNNIYRRHRVTHSQNMTNPAVGSDSNFAAPTYYLTNVMINNPNNAFAGSQTAPQSVGTTAPAAAQ